ncbi:MAG: hypothetical protein L0227_20275, partial [Chloroflexi bacterium]|nr:hypothetical protein [Chloroflexota bacterium]
SDGDDVLLGGSGADAIAGGPGNDRLYGNSNSNPFNGGNDSNVLLGGEGDDQLQGGFGDDLLDGGPGNDTMSGGAGADAYAWGLGDGVDVVSASGRGEGDVVELKAGLAPADVTLTQGSIVITVKSTGESLTLEDWYAEAGPLNRAAASVTVSELRFADGTVWDAALINENANHATPFSDTLRGMATPDVLHGLDGDDLLEGFSGDDVLAGGDGADTLNGSLGADELDGGADDDDLLGGLGDDLLLGGAGADLLDGDAGDDWLDGGAGDDDLRGGAGDDVYYFEPGDGADVISSEGWSAAIDDATRDVIEFGGAIASADVRVFGDWSALVIDYGSGQVRLPLGVAGNPASHGVEAVQFADGTSWTREDLLARTASRPQVLAGTSSANFLSGSAGDDLIDGGAGDDTLLGAAGDDTLIGGGGHDVLSGGDGNDVLTGGDGVDTLNGDTGDDSLEGGAGDDQMNGGRGSDAYRLGLDTGHDLVADARLDPFHFLAWPGDRNVVLVDEGIAPSELAVSRLGDDLALETPGAVSSMRVAGWFSSEFGLGPLSVRFADGTEWNEDQLGAFVGYVAPDGLDQILAGTAGNDLLEGGYGN